MPLADALAAVTGWYRARGLPPMIAVPRPMPPSLAMSPSLAPSLAEVLAGAGSGPPGPDLDHFLAERNWATRPAPAFVMVAPAVGNAGLSPAPPGTVLAIDAEPDDAWLAMYHYRGQAGLPPVARRVLRSAPWQGFASFRRPGGEPVAIARVSVGGGWAGITAVEVSRERRRQGLGTAITRAVCAQAARRGAQRVFLQVEIDNAAAQAMYQRCGFTYSHRYHYRVAPPA
jgi:ribosomal protein S18 acetylase RimI-like enzyme